MRQRIGALLCALLLALLAACGQGGGGDAWQEQYDLGMKYLSEGNYQEAVIAFTAAIEIDPKRAEAYSGLADAYIAMGEYDKAAAVWADTQGAVGDEALLTAFAAREKQYAEIRAALEAGETGVWITSLAFDKESFLAGEETVFRLGVLYSAPQGGECLLTAGANVEDTDSWKWLEEDTMSGGLGVRQIEVSVTPARWERVYFGLSASLHAPGGGEYWDYLAGDTWYITPEGEVVSHRGPLNAYGAVVFTSRQGYMDFEDLTDGEQQFIASAAAAAMAGDKEAMAALLGFRFENYVTCTMWNGYKVEVDSYSRTEADSQGSSVQSISIQLRPENGTGYYAYLNGRRLVNPSLVTEDYWMDYFDHWQFITCACTDWQWNGAVSSMDLEEYLWRHREGSSNHSTQTRQITGTMADGLWEGTASVTTRTVEDWTPWDDVDETTTDTRLFQNGILVEENGQPSEYGEGYHLVQDGYGGGRTYAEEQSFLDARYW